MEITIKGTNKEIAEFVQQLQKQQSEINVNNLIYHLRKSIDDIIQKP